jgi:hypothetical protein
MASELRHYEQFFDLHSALTLNNGIGPSALLFAGADNFVPVNYATADLLQSPTAQRNAGFRLGPQFIPRKWLSPALDANCLKCVVGDIAEAAIAPLDSP